jgi:hypothetical protein
MTEDELLALVEAEERNCISSTSGALAEQRREALQYYYGQPYGNEIEGRSQVVTTEVKDAVEGILPALMAIFTSAEEIVRFEAQNPDDEAAAQQATDYVNYIFRVNNGFMTLYCLFKDALLLKNGYAKVYWENYSDQSKETYESLSDDQLAMLQQDPELEMVSLESRPDEYASQAIAQQVMQMQAQGKPIPNIPQPMLHDAVFKRTKEYGKVCIDPTPPDEILISRGTPNDLTKARFVEHRTKKTLSQIREMGFMVADDIADNSDADWNEERFERNRFDDADAEKDSSGGDPSTREVWFCEAYMHVDFDGDGFAEFRKISKIGSTLLDNVEFDSLPIIGGSAIVMPHKHNGLSVHDLVKDIQLIKSTITRSVLDNAYVQNQGRMVVLDGMVNMEDLLNVRPNGIIRAKSMNAVQRLDNPMLGAPFYNLLEYFDRVKINRVGSRDFGDAVDKDALNAKAHTAEIVQNASQERINLMARLLGEGPVKAMFWKILEVVSKHQDKPQMMKLRGQWVPVDPREWHKKFNMTVTVGLGTGSQQATINGVMALSGMVGGFVQMGYGRIFTEQNVYNLVHRAAKAVFPKDSELFATDPKMLPPPQPQPNPDLMKIQLAAEKASMGNKQKYDKMMLDWQNAEANRKVVLKQMGVDILEMENDYHMAKLDRKQETLEAAMDRTVDFEKHRQTVSARNTQP